MKSYQVAEIVKTFAPAGLRDDEAKPVPVAQTAWLDAHNATDFSLRETFWQIALLPIDMRVRTVAVELALFCYDDYPPSVKSTVGNLGTRFFLSVPCFPALLVSTGSVAGAARLARLLNGGTQGRYPWRLLERGNSKSW